MAQSKVTKKPGRHNRNNRSERTQNAVPAEHKEYPLVIAANSGETEHLPGSAPALLSGPRNDAPAQAESKPTPLALIAQPAQAKAAREPNRKFATMMSALLVSICVIGAAIFSFGTSKTNGDEMQMAQAGANALPITPASDSGKGEHAANSAPSAEKRAATAHVKRAEAKPTVNASKSGASSPRKEKKTAQARTKPDAQQAAGIAKKAPAIAKAPKKAPENKPMPLLAQNSATQGSESTGAAGSYAQCQALGNFFRREQCKWQACNGKWGQDGCPSYAGNDGEYN